MLDLTDQQFGRLTVVARAENMGRHAAWTCACSCGNIKDVRGDSLRGGIVLSCGCLRNEVASKLTTIRNTTHKLSSRENRHPDYSRWCNMKARCYNTNCTNYKNYGGRGITVCDEWRDDFAAFLNHISGLTHYGEEGYSFDRINNDGPYEPGNVQWATSSEQNLNRRKRHVSKS